MTSIYLPLSRDVFIELILDPEIEDIVDVVIMGRHFEPKHVFGPTINHWRECALEQVRLNTLGLTSDATKLNELEFCSSKFNDRF
jgi:hypothetical protein